MTNPILDLVAQTLKDSTAAANSKADEILAATTDKTKRVHEIRTTEATEDETILKYREWLEKVNAQIEENTKRVDAYIADKHLKSVPEADLAALKEQYAELKATAVAGRKFAETIPGVSAEELAAALKDVPDLKSLRGGTSGGTGEGGKRPRIERISVSKDDGTTYTEVSETVKNAKTGKDEVKANFTILARWLSKDADAKVEVKDLQAHAFEAAKTDDLSTLNGTVFDFEVTVKDNRYFVKVQPAVPSAKAEVKTEAKAEESAPEANTETPEVTPEVPAAE